MVDLITGPFQPSGPGLGQALRIDDVSGPPGTLLAVPKRDWATGDDISQAIDSGWPRASGTALQDGIPTTAEETNLQAF